MDDLRQENKRLRLLQEIKDPVKRAATSSQFQQYASIPDHYSLELALSK
jgi:chromosome condensin MukBEF ATPase and DNA-binding subunit MukB